MNNVVNKNTYTDPTGDVEVTLELHPDLHQRATMLQFELSKIKAIAFSEANLELNNHSQYGVSVGIAVGNDSMVLHRHENVAPQLTYTNADNSLYQLMEDAFGEFTYEEY